MKGRTPKPPELVQRRNQVATRAELPAKPKRIAAPKLPVRPTHEGRACALPQPETRAWWRDVWRSPMAAEFLKADTHRLYALAALVDEYWRAVKTGEARLAAAIAPEIRLEGACFGLTPFDRKRLQWTIAGEGPRTKRAATTPAPEPSPGEPADDPRRLLVAIK